MRRGLTNLMERCTIRRFATVALAMNEPIGNGGDGVSNEAPLLGFLSLVMPALAWATR